MISPGAWKKITDLEPAWLIHSPSLLILRKA